MDYEIFERNYAQARTFISVDAIPDKLKQHPFWNVWKYEYDPEKPKPQKVPYNVNADRRRGSSTNTATFNSFDKAVNVYQGDTENFYSGIGLGIFDNICGIDIDDCLDENGMPSELAQEFINTMRSYTEISPSGRGIRIFVFINETFDKERYKAKYKKKQDKIGLEIYIGDTTNRYLTVTGNIGDGEPMDIADRTAEVMQMLDKYMRNNHPTTAEPKQLEITPTMESHSVSGYYPENFLKTVADVLEHAMNTKNSDKFYSLFKGDISGYESHSQADQAFCNLLAFWCGCDTGLMDSVFRQSNLIRNKWDEKHGNQTYGTMTLEKAVANCTQVYDPNYRSSNDNQSGISGREQTRRKNKYVSPYDADGTGTLTIRNLSEYMKKKGYSGYYDVILHDVEYSGIDGIPGELANNVLLSIIENDLKTELKGVNIERIDNYLSVLVAKNYRNPIREMIERTEWDGKDRLSQWYQLFEIPEDDKLSRLLIKKFSMQCICGLYNDGKDPFSLDIALVFQGAQGIAKSGFFRHLAIEPKYFKDGATLDPANRDSVQQNTSVWICELGEIGSTMKKDVDRLKAFISNPKDTYRSAYARKAAIYPRRTSFVGTVNDETFLLDQTGNRRFATVPLKITHSLAWETQIKPFDSLQFWAQIYSIVQEELRNGKTIDGCFRLTEQEKAALEMRNADFVKPMPYELEVIDVLTKYQIMNPTRVEYKFTTPTNWLAFNPELRNCNAQKLGKILAKHGYERKIQRINGKPVYGYVLPFEKRY